MTKLVGLARTVTTIFLIMTLGFVYANLPENVVVLYDDTGASTYTIERSNFFYYSLIIVLLLNLVSSVFTKLFASIPANPEKFFFQTESFKENFVTWVGSFSPVTNLFFIFVLSFIGIYNNGDRQLIENYGYLAYLGQFLVLGWLISAVVIISKRNN